MSILFLGIVASGFDWTITLGNVVQSIATAGSAFGVAWFINQKLQTYGRERDLIIGWIESTRELLGNFSILDSGMDYEEVVRLESQVRQRISTGQHILSELGYAHLTARFDEIENSLEIVRALLTDLPKATTQDDCSAVKAGRATYRGNRLATLRVQMDKLDKNLFLLQVAVNNGGRERNG